MDKMEKDINTILKNSTDEEISEFYGNADWKGLVYYVSNWDTPFDENPIYKNYMQKPFFEALKFLESLFVACDNYLYEKSENS